MFDRPERTVRDTYVRVLGAERAEAVPLSPLGLLSEADLGQPVGHLSVGQRRRLALALLVARPPELLLLDEPTNHLSPGCATNWSPPWVPAPARSSWPATTADCGRRRQGHEFQLPQQ